MLASELKTKTPDQLREQLALVSRRLMVEQEVAMARNGHTVHAQVDEHYVPIRNLRNDYLIDRHDQKHNSFTGIQGVSEQDSAIQDSQGPIVDRTREHLGAAANLRVADIAIGPDNREKLFGIDPLTYL